ncbi:LemA family protein [Flammeovirga sp. MY04]|nr:LemA family protein [Flammeovirga sp. MY04]
MVLAIIFSGIILIIIFYFISVNNSLISIRNQVENAFGGIDVQLKKRYDLIPNMVETVKQYMAHEKEVLTNLTSMRAKAMSGNVSAEEKMDLDAQMSSAMKSIMVSVENYPELKASKNMELLQRSLNEVEAQISAARRTYNSAVTKYNTSIEVFPNSIIANSQGYERKSVFEISSVERENVQIKNLF